MALSNSLQTMTEDTKKKTFSQFLIPKKTNITGILGNERTVRFFSSIITSVASNPALKDCEYDSILSGALLGESLGLLHSPQLGQYYLVPFKKRWKDESNKWHEISQAQFILGVKGWKQLAIRSGQYRSMGVISVKQGEYKGRDKWTGEPIFEFIENEEERNKLPVIGYRAYFELTNGFWASLYRSKQEMLEHADRYSQAFSLYGEKTNKYTKVSYEEFLKNYDKLKDDRLYSSFWYKDFDTMACGKVLKKLIQEYGVLSVDLQKAIESDDKVIDSFETNELNEVEVSGYYPENGSKTDEMEFSEEVAVKDEKAEIKANKTAENKGNKETEEDYNPENEELSFFG